MTVLLAVLLGIPLTIELLGSCQAVYDARQDREQRAAAVERLAPRLLAWGVLWWLLGATAWHALAWVTVLVAAWQTVAFYAARWLSRWSSFQTVAVDRDDSGSGP
jgi:hypothetical protein